MRSAILSVAAIATLSSRALSQELPDYRPSYQMPNGEQIVVAFVAMKGVAHAPSIKQNIRRMKPLVARSAAAEGRAVSMVGISLDWNADEGFALLKEFGAWDAIVLGANWTNSAAEQLIWRDTAGKAHVPQIIVYSRTVHGSDVSRLSFGANRVLRRLVGHDEITAWVNAGAPLPTEVGIMPRQPMFLTLRSVDSTRVPDITIRVQGRLFGRLGVAKPFDGAMLHLQGSDGTARGGLDGELSTEPGELVFSSSILGPELEIVVWPQSGDAVPRLTAKGRTVRVIRDPSGALSTRTGS